MVEKWVNRVRSGAYLKNGENEKSVGSSPKPDKMNTGWVLMEKWVKLVRFGVGRKMSSSKVRGLPEKWSKNG